MSYIAEETRYSTKLGDYCGIAIVVKKIAHAVVSTMQRPKGLRAHVVYNPYPRVAQPTKSISLQCSRLISFAASSLPRKTSVYRL